MAGGSNFSEDKCSFCAAPTSQLNSVSSSNPALLSYLYHQNVREAIAVGGDASVPQLTFTLSVGGNENQNERGSENAKFCEECRTELGNLQKLHQQLEAVKKTIEVQVQKINRRRHLRQDNPSKDLGNYGSPPMSMSLAGLVTGKENITRALNFLGNFCTDISEPKRPPSSTNLLLTSEEVNQDMADDPERNLPIDPQVKIDLDSTTHTEAYQPDRLIKQENLLDQEPDITEPEIKITPFFVSDTTTAVAPAIIIPEILPDADPLADFGGGQSTSSLSSNSQNSSKFRPVACSECGKVVQRKGFQAHMRSHSVVKRYQCDLCDERFASTGTLSRHKKLHTEEKKFACGFCERSFHRKEHMEKHWKRIHTEKLPG